MPIHGSLNQTTGNSCIQLHVPPPILLLTPALTRLFPRVFQHSNFAENNPIEKIKQLWIGFGCETAQLDCGKSCCSISYRRTRVIPAPLFPLGNSLTACIKEKMPIPTKKCNSKYILEIQNFHNVKIM